MHAAETSFPLRESSVGVLPSLLEMEKLSLELETARVLNSLLIWVLALLSIYS